MDFFVSHNLQIRLVEAPPSKSFAQRAILAAALCPEQTFLSHIGQCDDVLNALKMAKQLGAEINPVGNNVWIQGGTKPRQSKINAGESGLGIRLATAICAALPGNYLLEGAGSLLKRNMTDFDQILPQLGVDYALNNGFLPVKINGTARGGDLIINGNLSSQYLSGLLMALPLLAKNSTITVNDLKSKPYIDITLDILAKFHIAVDHDDYSFYKIAGNQPYKSPGKITIEGDYSGASVWMVHGALTKGIVIEQLNPQSVQGDKHMLQALSNARIQFKWHENKLEIFPGEVNPFTFDANTCPDLFPALVVLAAAGHGKSVLKGALRLLHKESNRALVLQREFGKLGLTIELDNDLMIVHGTGSLNSGTIDACNDHRIAMAGAVAATLTLDGVNILDAQSVSKSYPNFWNLFL